MKPVPDTILSIGPYTTDTHNGKPTRIDTGEQFPDLVKPVPERIHWAPEKDRVYDWEGWVPQDAKPGEIVVAAPETIKGWKWAAPPTSSNVMRPITWDEEDQALADADWTRDKAPKSIIRPIAIFVGGMALALAVLLVSFYATTIVQEWFTWLQ